MFSRNLLVARKRKPFITPVYIFPDDTELAETIIEIYKKGKTKEEIDEETLSVETHANFRVVRGLSELVRRRTSFEESYSADPQAVRRFLFEKGYAITEEEREMRLGEACQHFGVSLQEIESSFWADREEYQKVSLVEEISPSCLVRQYNLSLSQTLLFDALSLEFKTTGNFQDIFRHTKYLGLMYEVQSEKVIVTGPASVFKKTKKYGTSLAKLLPTIMRAPSWEIKAQIETMVAGEPRIYIFELSDSRKEYFPETIEVRECFDSEVEENFLRRFSALRKDWLVKREPAILKAGPHVMIPDFSLERRGKTCYVEIVGFWTPEYLEKKVQKVKLLKENILLCVSKELQCARKDFQHADVIFYDKEVPMKPVLERIRKMELEQLEEEKRKMGEVRVEGDVVLLEDVARIQNVGMETLKEYLEKGGEGVVIGDRFVKNVVLEKMKKEIEGLTDMRFSSVRGILDSHGLNEDVLGRIGFEIEWKTLDLDNAVVKKVK